MAALKADRDKIPGVASPGKDPKKAMMERNSRFFDAPVVVYLCMDRALTPWSIFDIGMLSQSIMLAAQEYGVDSIPAVMLAAYPELIRAELHIPPDLLVLFGIGLGYRDAQQLNQVRTPRRPLNEVVHIKGLKPAVIRPSTDAARGRKDTMKPVAGLWIDHRRAVVVVVTDKGEETRTIESNAEKHVQRAAGSRHGGRFESQAVPADDSHQREYTGELDRYYNRVAAHIRDAEAVLIFGPGEAKGELKKRIDQGPGGGRIVGVEAADKMTVSQIVTKVRRRFTKP
jgi:hypothetical protein